MDKFLMFMMKLPKIRIPNSSMNIFQDYNYHHMQLRKRKRNNIKL